MLSLFNYCALTGLGSDVMGDALQRAYADWVATKCQGMPPAAARSHLREFGRTLRGRVSAYRRAQTGEVGTAERRRLMRLVVDNTIVNPPKDPSP